MSKMPMTGKAKKNDGLNTDSLKNSAFLQSGIKKALPLVVSGLLLYYYFRDQDWGALLAAASRAEIQTAVLAILIPQLIIWVFDVLIIDRHFRWFHAPFDWRAFFWVRGAFYIILLVNYTIGGGGLLLYLQRKTRMTWARLMGICLFRFGLTMFGICLLLIPATLAMQYSDLAAKARINMHLWWGGLIFSTLWMIESWTYWHHKRGAGLSSLLAGNRESEFWTAFQNASRKQWLLTWAMGLPPILIMLSGIYILALAFNIRIPLAEYIVVAPLMFAIADLPVSFGGFGTMTMAWFLFFGDYGASEDIAALTLFLPAVRAVIRAAIGMVSLPFAMKDVPTLINGSIPGITDQPPPEPGEA